VSPEVNGGNDVIEEDLERDEIDYNIDGEVILF